MGTDLLCMPAWAVLSLRSTEMQRHNCCLSAELPWHYCWIGTELPRMPVWGVQSRWSTQLPRLNSWRSTHLLSMPVGALRCQDLRSTELPRHDSWRVLTCWGLSVQGVLTCKAMTFEYWLVLSCHGIIFWGVLSELACLLEYWVAKAELLKYWGSAEWHYHWSTDLLYMPAWSTELQRPNCCWSTELPRQYCWRSTE